MLRAQVAAIKEKAKDKGLSEEEGEKEQGIVEGLVIESCLIRFGSTVNQLS